MIDYELIHDEENNQYVFHIDGYIADLQYIEEGEKVLKVTHVGVPTELEGKGVASQLVEKSLKDMESRGYKIIPICPFVVAYIQRHTEWEKIVECQL